MSDPYSPSMNQWLAIQQQNIAHQNALNLSQLQQGVSNGNWLTPSQIHGIPAIQPGSFYPGRAETYSLSTVERTDPRWGEITGWRMWNLKDDYLTSYSANHAWPPGEVIEGMPSESNHEGIWAFKTHSRALKKATEGHICICGSILMWGEIIEYTEGYRAQYAKIKSLDDAVGFSWKEKKHVLAILREHYGLNV